MASKVTVFTTAPASWLLPGDFSPVTKPPWNCNSSRHPNSGCMACPHFQRTREEPVLPLTTCVDFGVAFGDCYIVYHVKEVQLLWFSDGSPGFQDFCKDLPTVSNQVVTWYLKLITCKSASKELEEEQSIQNRGDTFQSETTTWSHGGEKLWGCSCWFPSSAGYLPGHQGKAPWSASYLGGNTATLGIVLSFELLECFLGSFRTELPPVLLIFVKFCI